MDPGKKEPVKRQASAGKRAQPQKGIVEARVCLVMG